MAKTYKLVNNLAQARNGVTVNILDKRRQPVRGLTIDPFGESERLTEAEAFSIEVKHLVDSGRISRVIVQTPAPKPPAPKPPAPKPEPEKTEEPADDKGADKKKNKATAAKPGRNN